MGKEQMSWWDGIVAEDSFLREAGVGFGDWAARWFGRRATSIKALKG